MSAVPRMTESSTFLPSERDQGRLLDFVRAMRARGRDAQPMPMMITAAGEQITMSSEVASMMLEVLDTLANGQAVTVIPRQRMLTTQEAADLLNISRPTFVKILDRGELPFEMRGRHRRVRLEDLLQYQRSLEAVRGEELDAMQRDAEADGLYELLDRPES